MEQWERGREEREKIEKKEREERERREEERRIERERLEAARIAVWMQERQRWKNNYKRWASLRNGNSCKKGA